MLDTYDCAVIGEIHACNGYINICAFEHEGELIAFYLSFIGSAGASGCCFETNWLTGATKFIMLGSCGSLDRDKTYGKFIIPTEVYRGDGASYLYAPASDYLGVKNAERVAKIFGELELPCVSGRVWTTDSVSVFFRCILRYFFGILFNIVF